MANSSFSIEREKLRQSRAAPRKMKKHKNEWAGFEADVEGGFITEIRLSDIPFPPKGNPLLLRGKAEDASAADRKTAFRQASLRLHPDKFQAKYGRLLHDDEREAIMDKVTETFQAINDANG